MEFEKAIDLTNNELLGFVFNNKNPVAVLKNRSLLNCGIKLVEINFQTLLFKEKNCVYYFCGKTDDDEYECVAISDCIKKIVLPYSIIDFTVVNFGRLSNWLVVDEYETMHYVRMIDDEFEFEIKLGYKIQEVFYVSDYKILIHYVNGNIHYFRHTGNFCPNYSNRLFQCSNVEKVNVSSNSIIMKSSSLINFYFDDILDLENCVKNSIKINEIDIFITDSVEDFSDDCIVRIIVKNNKFHKLILNNEKYNIQKHDYCDIFLTSNNQNIFIGNQDGKEIIITSRYFSFDNSYDEKYVYVCSDGESYNAYPLYENKNKKSEL